MLSKEQKIKLILLFQDGIITKEQLQTVINLGYPAPVIMETKEITDREKEILSVSWIYRLLGQHIVGITFKAEQNVQSN